MKKIAADYSNFRFSRLNEPQFSHLKLLGSWILYFLFYFLTETLIPPDRCHVVHCKLDDLIPFCELFLIPYVFWYSLIVFSLVYFALYHIESFCNLQKYIIVTQVIAIAIYILFPTRQDLRPELFPRNNFLTEGISLLYRIDTNTGVCPSLHVAYSLGIASVWLKAPGVHRFWKGFVLISAILICLSTMFIKQHSAVDVFAALPMCMLAEWLVYHKELLSQWPDGNSAPSI